MNKTSTDEQDDNRQTLRERFLYPVRNIQQNKLARVVTGKTILITGASYGIGAMLTELLSEFEVRLVLVARTTEKLQELSEHHKHKPCTILAYPVDLRDEEEINKLLENLALAESGIDIYINNAGKSIHRGLTASIGRYHDTRRCSATNYTGPVQLMIGLLPALLRRKGHIINVSAQNVLLPPTAGWSAYQSSKVAFDQWLRCMEPELRAKEVMVSSVYLPLVRTRMSTVNNRNNSMPMMSRFKAAHAILRCLVHKKRKYRPWWTGIIVFFTHLFPNAWYRMQVRHYKKQR